MCISESLTLLPSRNGSTVIGSKEWTLLSNEPTFVGNSVEKHGDLSSKGPKNALNQGWVPVEKPVERRMWRSMKQSAEATVEIDRQRKVDLRWEEVELAMAAIIMQENDKQPESESLQEG
ncbi:unnamed protein product [Calypogeia fissa]